MLPVKEDSLLDEIEEEKDKVVSNIIGAISKKRNKAGIIDLVSDSIRDEAGIIDVDSSGGTSED